MKGYLCEGQLGAERGALLAAAQRSMGKPRSSQTDKYGVSQTEKGEAKQGKKNRKVSNT